MTPVWAAATALGSKRMTNNVAEFVGLHRVLVHAAARGWRNLHIVWDSEMILRMMRSRKPPKLGKLKLQHFFGELSSTDEPVMLMWDDFSAHWTPELVAFAVEKNVVLQCIPPGYTHCCQPTDIAWNKPLKDGIRAS
ncbi:reverse transcriptase [Phytophthora megakarya]|uniref:Reverse transcriptase n=1 Tax=Phytophthora megakarya TaxID=4795 RepID=A0A225WXF1_9STRA|nr:reverse transcriptase [Phytophthora megakarya]